MTLKEWLDHWISEKELPLKKVTLQSYKHRIAHIVDDFGSLQLFTLTKDIFTDLHRLLKQKNKVIFNGKVKIITNQRLSNRSIHVTPKVLKMALHQAYRDEKNSEKYYCLLQAASGCFKKSQCTQA
jgi:hypothetical protein